MNVTEPAFDEATLRRFLLGQVTGIERVQVEDKFLSDEAAFERLQVAEDELIDAYLVGELSPGEQQLFERNFLATPQGRARLAAMRALICAANREAERSQSARSEAQPSAYRSPFAAWLSLRGAAVPYSLAAAVLLAALVGTPLWLLSINRDQSPHIARQTSSLVPTAPPPSLSSSPPEPARPTAPALTVEPTPAPHLTGSSNSLTATERTRLGQEAGKQSTGPSLATLVLSSGLVRDPSAATRLNISASIEQVAIRLRLERSEYLSYRVHVSTVEGRRIWTSRLLKKQGSAVNISLPAKALPTGDYIVELSGLRADETPEIAAEYFFSVIHK